MLYIVALRVGVEGQKLYAITYIYGVEKSNLNTKIDISVRYCDTTQIGSSVYSCTVCRITQYDRPS